VASNDSLLRDNFAPARKAEILSKMRFLRRARRKEFHAFGDFHQAFLALALFAARSGNPNSQSFRAIEKRKARGEIVLVRIEV
jgi:hypothetical protein